MSSLFLPFTLYFFGLFFFVRIISWVLWTGWKRNIAIWKRNIATWGRLVSPIREEAFPLSVITCLADISVLISFFVSPKPIKILSRRCRRWCCFWSSSSTWSWEGDAKSFTFFSFAIKWFSAYHANYTFDYNYQLWFWLAYLHLLS